MRRLLPAAYRPAALEYDFYNNIGALYAEYDGKFGSFGLKAETAHTVNAVYNFFSPKWIVSMTLRQGFTGDGISQYSFYDDEHILNRTECFCDLDSGTEDKDNVQWRRKLHRHKEQGSWSEQQRMGLLSPGGYPAGSSVGSAS